MPDLWSSTALAPRPRKKLAFLTHIYILVCINMSAKPRLDKEMQDFLHAVAGESRQSLLLSFLNGRERTVGQLVGESGLGQSTISIQLGILHRAGLLLRRKQGKEVFYRPDRARIILLLDRLSSFLKKCC